MSCNIHVEGQWGQYKNMSAYVAADLAGQAIILSNSLKSQGMSLTMSNFPKQV